MNYADVNLSEATIVDVRTPQEFSLGAVDGSINIPLDQIPHKIEEFKTMNSPVVLCCKSGNRSGKAIEFLEANGLENLHNGGGWTDVNERL